MQGNKRTTKEGSSGLTFQNISPLKNRSWPRLSSAKGQYRTVPEPLPDSKHNFVTVLDGDKVPRDDDYEDPELQLLKEWPSMKILPARPIKESEYADTRYLKDMMDVPLLLHAKTSVPTERQSWSVGMRRREEVDKPTSRDVRSQRCTGARSTKVNKTPLPPPRPPVTLPKKYQPLPPEPESSALFPQRHTLPEAQRGPRQMSLKGFYEVLGAEKDSHHPIKPKPSQPLQNQNTQKSPPAITSFPGMPSKHSTQDRVRTVKHMDPTGIMQSCPPQRCHSPVSHSSPKSVLSYENTSRGKPTPTRSDGKDIQQNEWYIGEYSRQAVEEALMKESKDGTFLVRDCSTKSDTEPYVLVVFYGNKVYNVKIRFLERNQQFALGTGLRGTEKFDSVEDIIEHYKYFPIVLIDGKDKAGAHREQCYLTQPLALASHFRP